eukprot:COSAG06_NODE_4867_length_3892_cov_2.299763_2_plen_468_part_00
MRGRGGGSRGTRRSRSLDDVPDILLRKLLLSPARSPAPWRADCITAKSLGAKELGRLRQCSKRFDDDELIEHTARLLIVSRIPGWAKQEETWIRELARLEMPATPDPEFARPGRGQRHIKVSDGGALVTVPMRASCLRSANVATSKPMRSGIHRISFVVNTRPDNPGTETILGIAPAAFDSKTGLTPYREFSDDEDGAEDPKGDAQQGIGVTSGGQRARHNDLAGDGQGGDTPRFHFTKGDTVQLCLDLDADKFSLETKNGERLDAVVARNLRSPTSQFGDALARREITSWTTRCYGCKKDITTGEFFGREDGATEPNAESFEFANPGCPNSNDSDLCLECHGEMKAQLEEGFRWNVETGPGGSVRVSNDRWHTAGHPLIGLRVEGTWSSGVSRTAKVVGYLQAGEADDDEPLWKVEHEPTPNMRYAPQTEDLELHEVKEGILKLGQQEALEAWERHFVKVKNELAA